MVSLIRSHRPWFAFAGILVIAAASAARADEARGPVFEVQFSKELRDKPFTGRVIFFFNSDTRAEPRSAHGWTSREPIFSQEVRNWGPDTPMRFDQLNGFPCDPAELPAGKYAVQAVMHTNIDLPHSGKAPGNLYSKSRVVDWTPADAKVIRLRISKRVKSPAGSVKTKNARTVRIRSTCLSQFHGRDIFLQCTVAMPEAYHEHASIKFPAIYAIPGFGGNDREALMYATMLGLSKTPFVRIGLDATCPLGHHVFADSENNGPYGRALVEELVPHLEKVFRLIPEPTARFLTGHSSGGWSSLWVQITFPDYFGGTWSTSPDPVDFHAFSQLNLYDPRTNFFEQPSGTPWPIMRNDDDVKLLLKDMARMEDVIGPGGQLHSFEAVFSPRSKDGKPALLWDRATGKIDQRVVMAWRRYDICDKLRREWDSLGPKLAGKVTVIMGDADNFYLEGATKLLMAELEKLDADARVIIEPDRDHGTVMFSASFRRMIDEMSEKFTESHPDFSIPDDKPDEAAETKHNDDSPSEGEGEDLGS